jgi:hypothetical protein
MLCGYINMWCRFRILGLLAKHVAMVFQKSKIKDSRSDEGSRELVGELEADEWKPRSILTAWYKQQKPAIRVH